MLSTIAEGTRKIRTRSCRGSWMAPAPTSDRRFPPWALAPQPEASEFGALQLEAAASKAAASAAEPRFNHPVGADPCLARTWRSCRGVPQGWNP